MGRPRTPKFLFSNQYTFLESTRVPNQYKQFQPCQENLAVCVVALGGNMTFKILYIIIIEDSKRYIEKKER